MTTDVIKIGDLSDLWGYIRENDAYRYRVLSVDILCNSKLRSRFLEQMKELGYEEALFYCQREEIWKFDAKLDFIIIGGEVYCSDEYMETLVRMLIGS